MLQMQRSTQSQQKLMKRIPWVWNTGQCSRRISPPVKVRHVSSVNPSVVTGYSQSVKPFSAIPGPPRLPVLGTLLPYKLGIKDLPNYHHDVCQLYQKYGPVVREVFGSQTVVHVFNPADIQTIYESDGKTPHIPPLQETTRFYRQQKDMSLGLGNLNGNEWYKLRRAVQQMMLRPKEVSYYYPLQDSVAERVVEKLVGLVDDKGNVPELDFIVGKWILESAGMCCFEKSLGCLEGGEEEDLAQKLVEANMQIFKLSADLKFSLRLYRYLTTPKYKKLHNLEDFFYGVSLSFIREAMALIQSLMEEGKLSEGQFNFLTYLMSRQELSEKDVLTITLSLFSDGLSTTSPTLLGNLHCLALNPEVQERLYQDILMKVDPSTPITLDHINTLHYLKAFVKEVFRQEAEEFVTQVLEEQMPNGEIVSSEWINRLIKAFHRRLPFQNVTLLSGAGSVRVPTWEDIRRDVIQEGKGGLCLSLNIALVAILRALGVCAYSVAADYIASGGRGVHSVIIFHLCKNRETCCHTQSYAYTRPKRLCASRIERSSLKCELPEIKSFSISSLYLADVGCGFPTLQAVNLSEDMERVFLDCELEYRFSQRGLRYLRLHRMGDEVPSGEEDCVGEDGWRPVFSFTLTTRPLAHFHCTMRAIYLNRHTSPYFSELHAVRYSITRSQLPASTSQSISSTPYSFSGALKEKYSPIFEMIAIKNEFLIKSYVEKKEMQSGDNSEECVSKNELQQNKSKSEIYRDQKKLSRTELMVAFANYFPMIPRHEVEEAMSHFYSVKDNSN